MALLAKSIVKNKFWIVEKNGVKYATIQSAPDGVVFVQDDMREKFPSIKRLKSKYNIKFDRATKAAESSAKNDKKIYGFPFSGKAYNIMFDVVRKLPIFTKTKKSKSYYCAGYYRVLAGEQWQEYFCPKLILLNRYKFEGPFDEPQS